MPSPADIQLCPANAAANGAITSGFRSDDLLVSVLLLFRYCIRRTSSTNVLVTRSITRAFVSDVQSLAAAIANGL